MKAHYDDPNFFYDRYWTSRQYEHASEEIAINSLLSTGKFTHALDIGGGYGRLSKYLLKFSQKVTLIEPSKKQLEIAKKYLKGHLTKIKLLQSTAEKINLKANTADLGLMIRVMHHLPDPLPSLREISRVLTPSGLLVLEFANSSNLKARFTSFLSGDPILPLPKERRSSENIKKKTIPFVNHHPETVFKLLKKAGFIPIKVLSASNFRSTTIKKFVPGSLLLKMEKILQPLLAHLYFGPSIFILAKKKDPTENT